MRYNGKEYNKIMVIGCPGSGKSTFSKRLSVITGIPVSHMDAHWWLPGWQNTTKEEFDLWQKQAVKEPAWIMDGNFSRTLEIRLEEADAVFDFQIPLFQCLFGVIGRFLKYRNKTRSDMGEGCREQLDLEFLQFICSFNKNERPKNEEKLAKHPNVLHVVFKSRRESDEFLRMLGGSVY